MHFLHPQVGVIPNFKLLKITAEKNLKNNGQKDKDFTLQPNLTFNVPKILHFLITVITTRFSNKILGRISTQK